MALKRSRIFSVLIVAAALLFAACSYESAALGDVECDEEGAIDGDRVCQDGYWVHDGTLDAGDDVTDDTGDDVGDDADDVPCTAETDQELCDGYDGGRECGQWTITDSCGEERNVDCGDCGDEFCIEETGQCSPCPGISLDEICDEFVPEGDDECGFVDVPDDCEIDGPIECGCGETICGDWSECSTDPPVDQCIDSGTQTRSCTPMVCSEGSCEEGSEYTEQRDCQAPVETQCTDGVTACHEGFCQSDGTCLEESICAGTDSECGCESCEDCTELESDCTHDPSADCERPPTATGCPDWGVQDANCYDYVCNPDGTGCELSTTPTTGELSCVYDPTGDPCDISGCPSQTGVCASDGGSYTCEPPCPDGECGCTASECTDCSELGGQWVDDGDPYACCDDDDDPCECQDQIMEIYGCNDAGTGCEVVDTETQTVTTGCIACGGPHTECVSDDPASACCVYDPPGSDPSYNCIECSGSDCTATTEP